MEGLGRRGDGVCLLRCVCLWVCAHARTKEKVWRFLQCDKWNKNKGDKDLKGTSMNVCKFTSKFR